MMKGSLLRITHNDNIFRNSEKNYRIISPHHEPHKLYHRTVGGNRKKLAKIQKVVFSSEEAETLHKDFQNTCAYDDAIHFSY